MSFARWIGVLMLALWVVGVFILSGCSSHDDRIYSRGPLFEQRLAVRPGHEASLTNQTCKLREEGKCVEMDVKVYDMRGSEIREQLVDLKFVCNVAGVRYRIDRNAPDLVHQKCERSWFKRKCEVVSRLSFVDDFDRLVNSATVCAAQDSAMGQVLFSMP